MNYSGFFGNEDTGIPVSFILMLLCLAAFPVPALAEGPETGNGWLTVTTVPSGAQVLVGGSTIGVTPLESYSMPADDYLGTILKDGYLPVQNSFTIRAGQVTTLRITLEPLSPTLPPTTEPTWITITPTTIPPGLGSIYATSSPGGASIFLNGAFQGYAPLLIANLPPRTYTLLARLENYNDYSQYVTVYSGQQSLFEAQMTQSPIHNDYGYINIASNPPGSSVYVNGDYKGVTPVTVTEYPGSRTVLLQKTGYYDYSQTVNVVAGGTSYVSASLSPVPPSGSGSILVRSSPPAANVYLDNNYRGQTDSSGVLTLSNIAVGSHAVRLTKPRYNDYISQVSVNPGQQAYIQAILTPAGDLPTPTPTTSPGGTGSLSIDSVPAGAMVYLDNVYKGYTPIILQGLSSGMHAVLLTLAGYENYNTAVQVLPGASTPLQVTLSPSPVETKTPLGLPIVITSLATGIFIAYFWRKKP